MRFFLNTAPKFLVSHCRLNEKAADTLMTRRDDLRIIGAGTFGTIRTKPFHYVAFSNDLAQRINGSSPPLRLSSSRSPATLKASGLQGEKKQPVGP